ncbi:hypothetical protein Ae201684P_021757 [Aphanomyces euteiches]|uniref:Transmembrane protein n=1 Tax=Aphanomyces euteiches TaxID=100861 RepID=A0A6G0WSM1_9STRA|nr:hypothetical protein Ae201684_012130 [Aphanomyces euteiches]KAH9056017.1 hypothetical protein Ae201684P_021757 [Aphanomyces euteiches]
MSRLGAKLRVVPSTLSLINPPTSPQSANSQTPLAFITSAPLSYAYLFFTISCGIGFVVLLSEYTSNDHWWREFNTTGSHTFLADVFNSKLNQRQHGDFDLFDSSLPKDYSASTFIDMRPTATRQILLGLISFEQAVSTIRANSLYESVFTVIAYCWVDFNHRFELAHTAKRQQRCVKHQYTNAAVHLEAVLRNVGPIDLAQSSYGVQINQTILSAVVQTPEGSAWLTAMRARNWGSVSDEAAFWRSNGLDQFAIQPQNRFQPGCLNTVTIINALGVSRTMTTHSVPYIVLGLATWSTKYISSGLWTDMTKCITLECTMVRNMNNSLEAIGRNWDTVYTGTALSTGSDLVRTFIGPLMNWDTFYIVPPGSLINLVVVFQTQLYQRLQTDISFSSAYQGMVDVDIDAVPPSWKGLGLSYFGGNPLCAPVASGKPFVQMPFSFDDACQLQQRFGITFTRPGVLFSAWMSQLTSRNVDGVCNCSVLSATACSNFLTTSSSLVADFSKPSNVQSVVQDIQSLNLLFIQLATQNTTKLLLTQPIVQYPTDSWSPLGWVTLYDWVDGTREALNFEGDAGNMTLLSARSSYLPLAAKPLELPRTACRYFRYMSLYFTCISVIISLVVLAYAVTNKFQGDVSNVLHFNRVVGSVWIGRPILFLRGLTAILILSTSPTTLTISSIMTYFDRSTRTWLTRALLSGESLWILYVLNDALLPLTNRAPKTYVALHEILSFLAVFSIEVVMPVKIHASVNQKCTFTSFRQGPVCNGGQVEIGHWSRAILLIMIQVICLAVSLIATWIYFWYSQKHKAHSFQLCMPEHSLIPAASDAFLVTSNSSTRPLDSVGCVMSGLLPLPSSVFNFNLWALVAKKFGSEKQEGDGDKNPQIPPSPTPTFTRRHSALGYASLLYMVGTITSSFEFLQITSSAMSNDFWWASFDASTQTYLSNWYNLNLHYTNATSSIDITVPEFGALATTTNTTVTTLNISPLSGILVQNFANSLANVIRGLRQMDGCQIPWIMTVYCYVDFDRRWEMAPTQSMQDRCKKDSSNSAIYLESILRNADDKTFFECWERSLDIALFSYLKTSADGLAWLSKTKPSGISIGAEVDYWMSSGLTTYITQWQNYKSIGIAESFYIQNAFGLSYPLTLKYINSSFQLSVQTSLKMLMPLAQSLTAILSNTSGISAKSLIRGSPTYAFANSTQEDALMNTGFLGSPLGPGLALVRNLLGPFGSVTMTRVPFPESLRGLYQNISFELIKILSLNREIQDAFWPLHSSLVFAPRPRAWEGATLGGGNILCDVVVGTITGALPGVFFSSTGSCGVNVQEFLTRDTIAWLAGLVATGPINVSAVARMETRNSANTKVSLATTVGLLNKFLPVDTAKALLTRAQESRAVIKNELHISLAQFLRRESVLSLSFFPLFSDDEPDFDFFSWLFLFDWIQGQREVVKFQGEK